ncbi:hypothetical protein EP7_005250 [Isosphaeraceae bacterium EP7]
MELREAMTQIAEIRLQLARTEVCRDFRSVPVAFSGVLAVGAAALQAAWVGNPTTQMDAYLVIWVGAAALSVAAAFAEMALRDRQFRPAWAREKTRLVVEQLVPCVVAGGLLTAVLSLRAPASAWMLPGLWQVVYSLGLFSACRLLPRGTSLVAGFYLASGLACLSVAQGPLALSAWAMGVPFGVGQMLAAAVLRRSGGGEADDVHA